LTPFGHHPSAWRQSRALEKLGFDALLSQVLGAEESGVDFVLLSDRLGIRPLDDLSPVATPFEPTTLVAALATKARRIGFLVAATTRQHEPYNLARRLASLDIISDGRTGWLAIGGANDSERDEEYLGLVSALWDSWEDDAFVYDKMRGRFFWPEKMHVLNHKGKNFSVRGPLNVNRSPQGKPVLAEILGEENGVLNALTVEVALLHADTLKGAIDIAHKFVRTAEAVGRKRGDIRILTNVMPVVAENSKDAFRINEALQPSDEDRLHQPLLAARLIGTPLEVADAMEQWLKDNPLDGFTILPPTLEIAECFLSTVVPELRRRGLIKSKSSATFREQLNLARPVHPAADLERAS
jgi:alkanesulfonate monooxygenase SsuD/methylene tetrahydromethanopterin reductase-like flavin-dependent oxidoreductase (luciferase family)